MHCRTLSMRKVVFHLTYTIIADRIGNCGMANEFSNTDSKEWTSMCFSSNDLFFMIGIMGALVEAYCFLKGHGNDDNHNHGSGAVGALASSAV